MVPVPLHQIPHVLHIRRHIPKQPILIHHRDPDPVQDVQQRGRRRVMTHPPPVAADTAHGLGTEQVDTVRDGHAHGAKVVVVAEPADLLGDEQREHARA